MIEINPFDFGAPTGILSPEQRCFLTVSSREECIVATWGVDPTETFTLPDGQRANIRTVLIHFGKSTPCPIRTVLINKLYSDTDPCVKFPSRNYFGYAHYPKVTMTVPGLSGICALYHINIYLMQNVPFKVESMRGGRFFLSGMLIRPLV